MKSFLLLLFVYATIFGSLFYLLFFSESAVGVSSTTDARKVEPSVNDIDPSLETMRKTFGYLKTALIYDMAYTGSISTIWISWWRNYTVFEDKILAIEEFCKYNKPLYPLVFSSPENKESFFEEEETRNDIPGFEEFVSKYNHTINNCQITYDPIGRYHADMPMLPYAHVGVNSTDNLKLIGEMLDDYRFRSIRSITVFGYDKGTVPELVKIMKNSHRKIRNVRITGHDFAINEQFSMDNFKLLTDYLQSPENQIESLSLTFPDKPDRKDLILLKQAFESKNCKVKEFSFFMKSLLSLDILKAASTKLKRLSFGMPDRKYSARFFEIVANSTIEQVQLNRNSRMTEKDKEFVNFEFVKALTSKTNRVSLVDTGGCLGMPMKHFTRILKHPNNKVKFLIADHFSCDKISSQDELEDFIDALKQPDCKLEFLQLSFHRRLLGNLTLDNLYSFRKETKININIRIPF